RRVGPPLALPDQVGEVAARRHETNAAGGRGEVNAHLGEESPVALR
ncbi:hypothetical protein LCGC14_2358450, partial [marine sediment metagenome]